MKREFSHGSPEQFIDALENRIEELSGGIESTTVIDASVDVDKDDRYEFIDQKSVQDSDGFYTDYTLYYDKETDNWFCMFGDDELYEPDPAYADMEFEGNEEAAREWFDSYTGFAEEEDEDIYSATNTAGIAVAPAVTDKIEAAKDIDARLVDLIENVEDALWDDIANLIWETDDDNLYITTVTNDRSRTVEFTIPLDDLKLTQEGKDDDVNYIVESVRVELSKPADDDFLKQFKSWTDVYQKFEDIVDLHYPDTDKIHEEVEKFYRRGEGNEFFDEAWERWNEGDGENFEEDEEIESSSATDISDLDPLYEDIEVPQSDEQWSEMDYLEHLRNGLINDEKDIPKGAKAVKTVYYKFLPYEDLSVSLYDDGKYYESTFYIGD